MLEWVAVPFSRGSSQPRDWTQVSRIAAGFFTSWASREAQVPSSSSSFFFLKPWYPLFFTVPISRFAYVGQILTVSIHLTQGPDSGPSLPRLFSVLDLQPPGLRKCPPLRQKAGLLTVWYKTANSPSLGFFPCSDALIQRAPSALPLEEKLGFGELRWPLTFWLLLLLLWQVNMWARNLCKKPQTPPGCRQHGFIKDVDNHNQKTPVYSRHNEASFQKESSMFQR